VHFCHLQALESLEETSKIDYFRALALQEGEEINNELEDTPQSMVTVGRVCNMLGEIAKRINEDEG
jgi:hypothetical protein